MASSLAIALAKTQTLSRASPLFAHEQKANTFATYVTLEAVAPRRPANYHADYNHVGLATTIDGVVCTGRASCTSTQSRGC
eukprot:COSAG03_NODE_111_length_12507_cov_28.124355_6_plen_81_part_00